MKRIVFFYLLITSVAFLSCATSKKTVSNHLSKNEKKQGYTLLFDGKNIEHWTGNTASYIPENGTITIHPEIGNGGNIYTKEEYSDFDFRFEFKLTPGANNGVGIRAPLDGDAAYVGMEIQILDNTAEEV